ncbi:MAG: NAD-dependent epimerase/dehydratase family protein [Deltaproteobacteria bacterium]|nr:NAD-dependent epimerase/dehydratase family protein [Deltaproteobacteria bacterium]
MHVLVTGGAGFIGHHVCMALLRRGDRVTCVDNFNDFYAPAIKENNVAQLEREGKDLFSLKRSDITDEKAVMRIMEQGRFDAVIHLAAWAGVRPSIEKPLLYQEVNVRGTTILLEACRRFGPKRFVFASSSSVYGNRKNVPFRETDNVDNPISPYAATKKAGELICYTYHHLHRMDVTCLRYFTVYGPGQRPEMAIHKFTRLIKNGRPIPMFGDGKTSRDYTFVDDIVQGTLSALDNAGGYNIYNLGNSRTIALEELISSIARLLGKEPHIKAMPMQAGDVEMTFADISKAARDLGYNPDFPLEKGLKIFVDWFNENMASK